MARAVHTVADWSDEEFDALLARAGALADGAAPNAVEAIVGMCVFQTSLRTRVGFEAAALRLGARFVEAAERRGSAESMPESLDDTIRVMSGYCDALVVRSPRVSAELARSARPGTAWVNAGDPTEHPTQTLIDVLALERLAGPVGGLRIAIVGDLRMRAARSLLALFDRRPPAALAVVTAPELADRPVPATAAVLESIADVPDVGPDVVYVVGIPHQAVPEPVRTRLRLDRDTLGRLSPDAIVLSPLPLIDEVASAARDDARIRWFEQSDLGLWARTAVLEHVLAAAPAS